MTNEQIKDIVVALIEKGFIDTSSFQNVIDSIVKAINTISTECQ